jgi:hypothetical protein
MHHFRRELQYNLCVDPPYTRPRADPRYKMRSMMAQSETDYLVFQKSKATGKLRHGP